MLNKYYKYRLSYKDFLIFIKSGNFYEVFDKDIKIVCLRYFISFFLV